MLSTCSTSQAPSADLLPSPDFRLTECLTASFDSSCHIMASKEGLLVMMPAHGSNVAAASPHARTHLTRGGAAAWLTCMALRRTEPAARLDLVCCAVHQDHLAGCLSLAHTCLSAGIQTAPQRPPHVTACQWACQHARPTHRRPEQACREPLAVARHVITACERCCIWPEPERGIAQRESCSLAFAGYL